MYWIAGILAVVVILWVISYFSGNPRFWHLASEYPNAAYDWFIEEDSWIVVGPEDVRILSACF